MSGDTSVVLSRGPRSAVVGAIIFSVVFGATVISSTWCGVHSYRSFGLGPMDVLLLELAALGYALVFWVLALSKTSLRFSSDGITATGFASLTLRWDEVQSVSATRWDWRSDVNNWRLNRPFVLLVRGRGFRNSYRVVVLARVLSPEALVDCLRVMFDRLPPDVVDTSVALLYGFAARSIAMRDSGATSDIIASATVFDFKRLQRAHAETPGEAAIVGEALTLMNRGVIASSVLGPLVTDPTAEWDVLLARALCLGPSYRPDASFLRRALQAHGLPPEIRLVLESRLPARPPGEHG